MPILIILVLFFVGMMVDACNASREKIACIQAGKQVVHRDCVAPTRVEGE